MIENMNEKPMGGSETLGAAGEKSRMTLFRDDRAEDFGAILLSVLVVAIIVVLTGRPPVSQPAAPSAIQTSLHAPAADKPTPK
ncbi:Preprotein translocase subunit SecG [Gammaproteobacteria bacterium]